MGKAIKNYRTSVKASITVGEIQAIMAKHASSVSVDYEQGTPTAVRFSIMLDSEIWFRLPCNPEGVRQTLVRDRAPNRSLEHARDVSWRIIKDWIHAQLAIVDAGQAKAAEVFFPYILESSGETLFQKFENQHLRLTAGNGHQ